MMYIETLKSDICFLTGNAGGFSAPVGCTALMVVVPTAPGTWMTLTTGWVLDTVDIVEPKNT